MRRFYELLRTFFFRTYIIPFETAFATLAIYSGIVGLFHFGITSDILVQTIGTWLAIVFSATYLIAGLGMLIGLGYGRKDIEAFGLIAVGTSIVIRLISTIYILGFTSIENPDKNITINGIFSSLVFILACGIRIHSILTGRQPIVVFPSGEVHIK